MDGTTLGAASVQGCWNDLIRSTTNAAIVAWVDSPDSVETAVQILAGDHPAQAGLHAIRCILRASPAVPPDLTTAMISLFVGISTTSLARTSK
jgi:hypothetical protein